MPAWDTLQKTVETELTLRREQGCETGELEAELKNAADDEAALIAVYRKLFELKPVSFPYDEPEDFDEIVKDFAASGSATFSEDELYEKLHGGWIGRCVGCDLGKPFETYPFVCGDEIHPHGWRHIKKYLEGANAWPLDYYVPATSAYTNEVPDARTSCPDSTRENIKWIDGDDDIRYTLIGTELFEKCGFGITPLDVARLWTERLAVHQVCTAEEEAYVNFSYEFPSSNPPTEAEFYKKLRLIRERNNPYREYLGARIRVDGYSMCAPGLPLKAAKMAFNDASLSHERNGVYSAMYVAALISLAYVEKDVRTLVERAKTIVPAKSREREAIDFAISVADKYDDFTDVAEAIWTKFEKYSWIHSLNNDSLLTAALLWSKGDFEKGITSAVVGALDTDCNGASVGCILGVMNGAHGIPAKWTDPVADSIHTEMVGITFIKVSECAQKALSAIKKHIPDIIKK